MTHTPLTLLYPVLQTQKPLMKKELGSAHWLGGVGRVVGGLGAVVLGMHIPEEKVYPVMQSQVCLALL